VNADVEIAGGIQNPASVTAFKDHLAMKVHPLTVTLDEKGIVVPCPPPPPPSAALTR
jgi:hypothetical protein